MARGFATILTSLVRAAREKPEQFEDGIRRQVGHARAAYNWTTRAQEWEQALQRLPRRA